eukprot:jgi/Orpsp1_1/1192077/evm.model.d7180000090449.1
MRAIKTNITYILITLTIVVCLSLLYISKNNDINDINLNESIIKGNKDNTKAIKFSEDDINKFQIKKSIDEMLLKDIKKPIDPQDFNDFRNKVELHTYLWRSIFGEYESDPETYRNNIIEHSAFLNEKNLKNLKWEEKLLAAIHQNVYPWLYGYRYQTFSDIIESSHGRGIVMCVGDRQFKFALSTIDAFRNILKCELPIEVFYNGNDDLSRENRNTLLSYEDVYVSDLTTYFDNSIVENSGWDSKPYAILASRFEEVMLMDSDVTYLRDPEELYEEEGYKNTGTLYFMDRSIFPEPYEGTEWLSSWMVNPLPETASLRFLNGTTTYEMESSTVVMHKTKTILGLLATCKLNEKKMRDDVVYKMYMVIRKHFGLVLIWLVNIFMEPTPCVFLGKLDDQNQICGHLGHVIRGKLYYWNGHIVVNKDNEELEYVDYESYAYDYIGSDWSSDMNCIIVDENKNPAQNMLPEELNIYRKIIAREKFKHFIIPNKEE